jgi:glycosyltransferase involved in cell wall biosynthesis
MIGIIVTTYKRPHVLERSLPQICSFNLPVLVVDDGSDDRDRYRNQQICALNNAIYFHMPVNRGLACALNIGLAFWLADKSIDWISYFQDDVDVHPTLMQRLTKAAEEYPTCLYTGYDSAYHQAVQSVNGFKLKKTSAGVHLHARSEFWRSIVPIPTYMLGAPKRVPGRVRGVGSNVDWWIVRDSPNSAVKRNQRILCIPRTVRTFLYKHEDSSWGNGQPLGEEPPLIP